MIVRKAFVKSLPVMAGYIVLGIGFGILLRNAGYGVAWAFAMAVAVYAGSMQYVGISLLAGGAGIITTIVTTVMVNARHLFYSISMVGMSRSRIFCGTGRYFQHRKATADKKAYRKISTRTVSFQSERLAGGENSRPSMNMARNAFALAMGVTKSTSVPGIRMPQRLRMIRTM